MKVVTVKEILDNFNPNSKCEVTYKDDKKVNYDNFKHVNWKNVKKIRIFKQAKTVLDKKSGELVTRDSVSFNIK